MATNTMKSNLYKMIDSLPETSLEKVKRFLEKLVSSPVSEEEGMTEEDRVWFSEGRKDAVKALSAIERELPDEVLKDYLNSFNSVARPIKWDKKRKTFIFLDTKQ